MSESKMSIEDAIRRIGGVRGGVAFEESVNVAIESMEEGGQLRADLAAARAEIVRLNGKTQFCSGCERLQREIDRMNGRRCDGCRNSEDSTLYKDHVYCGANADQVRNDHYCKAWQSIDDEVERSR